MTKIVVVHKTGFYDPEAIKKKLSGFDVDYFALDSISEEDLAKKVADSEFLMLNNEVVGNLTKTFYSTLKTLKSPLKHISIDLTAYEWASGDLAKEAGIKISNVPHYGTQGVAEYTITTILQVLKKLHLYNLTADKSAPLANTLTEDVRGKTLGIIGLGKIGGEVASIAQGFKMNVIGWNRTPQEIDGVENVDLDRLIQDSDVITIHLTTNEGTQKLFSYELFKKATKKPYLFNHTSGTLLNEDMILRLLNEEVIRCYATSRNFTSKKELQEHEHCISFPYQGWFTSQSMLNLEDTWIDNTIQATNETYVNLIGSTSSE